jgi:hypothetical protein
MGFRSSETLTGFLSFGNKFSTFENYLKVFRISPATHVGFRMFGNLFWLVSENAFIFSCDSASAIGIQLVPLVFLEDTLENYKGLVGDTFYQCQPGVLINAPKTVQYGSMYTLKKDARRKRPKKASECSETL